MNTNFTDIYMCVTFCGVQKMSLTEVRGNLFTSSDSLVHCVSRDLHMGKGIAAEFKKQFGGVDELRQQSKLVYCIEFSC